MSDSLVVSNSTNSSSSGASVPFQLTADGPASAANLVGFSVNVLERLSQSGIDTFTYAVSISVGCYIPCGAVGLQRFYDALKKAPVKAGVNAVMWFGFGHKSPIQILPETETGCKFAALAACLTEIYSVNMAGKIMLALTGRILKKFSIFDGQETSRMPSLFQITELVKKCAGIFATSSFSHLAEHFMSFDGEKIVGLRAWPHNTRANGRARVSRGVANEEDICNALFSVLELCQGTAEQITLVGVADAAGIAAIAKWLLDLKIILYTTDNETVENRLWYRNCEEKDAQLIVIYTRNIDSSAIIQSRRTVHLPDVTVLFRTGAQMRPSHDYVVSGRLRWEEALSGTFRDEFAALIAFPKLLGAAIGSAARVFTALAEADPNIPSDQLRRQSAYFPESHGEDFVYFCRERFPELQKADLESAMFRAARIGTYEEAFNAFNDTASQLAQACNCSTCCLGKYPRAGQHIATREEQRLNRDSSTRCLVVLMTTIIRLARGLYGILSIEGLGPRRKGLEYVYRVQTQRILQVNTRSSKKGRFVTFVDSLIEYAIPSTIQTECSLLRFAQWIFRSEEFLEEQEDPGITAISDDGICFFYDVLRDPQQKDPVMLCRVNVIPGHIQYHQRVFQAVNEKSTHLFSAGGSSLPSRPTIAVPEKTIETTRKCYGAKVKPIITEFISRASNQSLEVGFQITNINGMPITIVSPALVVQNIFRSVGLVNCHNHGCLSQDNVNLDLTAAIQQIKHHPDPVCSTEINGSRVVSFKPDFVARLVVTAECWQPILQRKECLLCCLRTGCESHWGDFAICIMNAL